MASRCIFQTSQVLEAPEMTLHMHWNRPVKVWPFICTAWLRMAMPYRLLGQCLKSLRTQIGKLTSEALRSCRLPPRRISCRPSVPCV